MGGGSFVGIGASSGGKHLYYYSFPYKAADFVLSTGEALKAEDNGNGHSDVLPAAYGPSAPLAYVFDPQSSSPFPTKPLCDAPANYVYDERTDAVRYDQQGPIFTLLPGGAGYTAIAVEVKVTSNHEACQNLKSQDGIVARAGQDINVTIDQPAIVNSINKPFGHADGNYVAWAIIDPAASVADDTGATDPVTGLGVASRWGWYNHYLVQYLDGGYVPTMKMDVVDPNDPNMMKMLTETVAIPQNLFYPATVGDGMGGMAAGKLGAGFDVLEFNRGDAKYSPICVVNTYVPDDINNPKSDASQFSMAELMSVMPTGQNIYCLVQ
jgi:hypothetical protein